MMRPPIAQRLATNVHHFSRRPSLKGLVYAARGY